MVSPSEGSIHVLHVDDEPNFAEMAAEFLTRHDDRFRVDIATSADDAIEQLSANRFDCVVSDYDMPGQNGIEFLQAVREADPDLPFILYTGKGSEEIASEAISMGVTEYLQKERGTSQYDVLANRIVNSVDKHRAQHELQDREERLNKFFEQSPLGVIRWDDEFNFARLNEAAEDILGYETGELVDQPWEVVIPEEDREEIGQVVVADLLADEGGYHSINENVRKDGERIVCEWHNWVVTDDNDTVNAVYSQFQDITERIERERELGELEEFNREIVENAPVGLFRLDEQMRITYENQRAEEIVGVPDGEDESPALGKDLRVLPSVQDTDAIDALNRLEAGETVAFDTPFESIFGKESYLTGKGVPLFDDGDFNGAIIMVVDTTERKEAEEILEQLRQNITDVVWMTTPDKESMDFVSEAYEDLMGRSAESLREDPLSFVDGIHPDDRDRVRAALEQQQQDPDDYEETYRVIRPDGEVRWVHDRASGVYEDGKLSRIVGIVTDITERQEREQELREQTRLNERFETLIDQTTDIIFTVDEAGTISYINSAVEETLGYAPAALEGTNGFELIHPDDMERAQDEFAAVLEDPAYVGNVEFRAEHKNGTTVELEVRARNQLDNAIIDGVIVIAREITERKQHERELGEKTRQFQGVLDSVDAAIWIRDLESRFKLINQNFRDLFGIDRALEVEGQSPSEILPEALATQFRENDRRAIEADDHIEFEEAVETTDGTKTYLTRISPLYDDGEMFATCGIATDITDLKRNQQKLERINEQLEGVVSIVSHDLRNPLNVASGRVELAREENDSEHLAVVERAHDRMEALIGDLLTLAREGERVREMEAVALADAVDASWGLIETTDATLEVETTQTIQADRSRLQQMLENLIRNAVKHGGSGVAVRVGDLDDGFFVEDDGPGIPAENLDEVFDAGFTTTSGGTGFGLNIVKQIADAHGWTIRAGEGSAGGARFEVTDVAVS